MELNYKQLLYKKDDTYQVIDAYFNQLEVNLVESTNHDVSWYLDLRASNYIVGEKSIFFSPNKFIAIESKLLESKATQSQELKMYE